MSSSMRAPRAVAYGQVRPGDGTGNPRLRRCWFLFVARILESEADVLQTVVPEPDDDAVLILTVHGSKGLEFPITILAGLGIGS